MNNSSLAGILLTIIFLAPLSNAETPDPNTTARAAINQLLDGFHAAAANADKEQYLGYFSDNAVFMGTDDWERWPLPEFTRYVSERFKGGVGWRYRSLERHINFSPAGDTAWFDEITLSEKWGRFRGTGVVLKTPGGWKLAHYSLTVLVPNEAWEQALAITKKAFAEREQQK